MELTDKEIAKKLGARMKEIRKERGLTQFEVASRCQIEESSYRRIENSGGFPNLRTILAISRAMEISMLDLFDFLQNNEISTS